MGLDWRLACGSAEVGMVPRLPQVLNWGGRPGLSPFLLHSLFPSLPLSCSLSLSLSLSPFPACGRYVMMFREQELHGFVAQVLDWGGRIGCQKRNRELHKSATWKRNIELHKSAAKKRNMERSIRIDRQWCVSQVRSDLPRTGVARRNPSGDLRRRFAVHPGRAGPARSRVAYGCHPPSLRSEKRFVF